MKKFFACMILALLPIVARSATNPVEVISLPTINSMADCVYLRTGCSGHFILDSYNLPNVGYHLSKFEYYGNVASYQFFGIQLTFTPDAGGTDIVSSLLGNPTGEIAGTTNVGGTLYTYPITKQVVSMITYGDYASAGDTGVQTMQFLFKDGTSLTIGSGNLTQLPKYTMNLCGNLIGMKCSFHTDPSAVINKQAGCRIIDDQQTSGYSFIQTVADFTYTLYQGTTVQKPWSTTNLSCYGEGYTATYTKNGSAISAPTFVTFVSTPASPYLTVTSISNADLGVYVVTIKGTLNTLNNPGTPGLPWTTSFSFTLTVVNDCPLTTITDKVITAMSNSVSLAATTQDVTFADSKATSHANPTFCGARTYTFSPIQTFLTISGTMMSLATSSVGDVGTYNVNLIISLTDYPAVPFITKNFNVTITCVVQTLTFSLAPAASTTLRLGIDAQPLDILFTASKTPACVQTVTFSISPTSTFLSLVELTDTAGKARISGALVGHLGTYAKLLTATVDAKTATAGFSVIIEDPCKTAVFQTTPAPLAMNVIMPSTATSTQNVVILTDVEVAQPSIVCPITATLTPAAAYISLSGDYQTISVNASLIITPTHYGTHPFTLTVQSANFSGTVAAKAYNFNVEISCAVTNLTIISQAVNALYTLNQGPLVTAAFTVVQAAACNYPFTYTQNYLKNGSSIAQPVWISFDSVTTKQLTMTITAPSDAGTYVITSTATIPQNGQGSNIVLSTNYSFNLTVQSDCVLTSITNKVITNMSQKVSLAAVTQDISFLDSIATSHAFPAYCGTRNYTLTPSFAFLTISGTNMSLATSSVGDVGTYNVDLKVSLTDYPAIPFITNNFDVTITCEVQTLTFSTLPAASTTVQVGIDTQPFSIPFFIIKAPACTQSVAFTLSPTTEAFTSLQNLSNSNGDVQINGATISNHGVYPYQLSASADLQTVVSNFSVFIKDPCSDAILRTSPSPVKDMTVYILDTQDQTLVLDQIQFTYPSIICAVQAIITPPVSFLGLSADSKVVSIDTKALTLLDVGSYDFIYKVSFKNFPTAPTQSYNFKVVLEDPCLLTELNSFALNPMSFTFGAKTSSVQSFDQATDQVSQMLKVPKLCGERKYELPDEYNFLTLFQPTDPWTKKFTLELITDKPYNVGSYTARIKVSLSNYPLIMPVEIPFKVQILPKIEILMLPYFKTQFQSATVLISETKKSWSIPLPEIVSPNSALNSMYFSLKADFGNAANFVKLKGMASINIDDISQHDGSNIRSGMYQIFFTLDDSKAQSKVLFTLFVIQPSKYKIAIPDLIKPFQIQEKEQVNEGEVSYLLWILDLLRKKMEFNQNLKFSRKPPSPFISKISHTGNVTIGFESEIYIFPNITVYNNGTVYLSDLLPKSQLGLLRRLGAVEEPVPVLKVDVLPGKESNIADLQYIWNVTQTNKTSININLYFQTPHRVSGNPIPDELKVTFYDTRIFMGFNGFLMEKDRQQIIHYLPPQNYRGGFDFEATKTISTAGSLVKSAVVSNFVLNILLSASLSELLGMIQAHQIMLLMSMFSLAIPANVAIFVSFVNKIASFDIIDTQPYLNKMLNLNETEPYNSNFDQAGYQSLYFLNNMGSLILAFVFYFIGLLFLNCINPFIKKSKCLESFSNSLKKSLLYESMIATIIQSYSQISICCLIGLSVISFKTYGESIQTLTNFFFFGVLFLFPAIMMIVLCRGWNSTNPLELLKRNRFGAFFSEFNDEKGPIIMLPPLWFMFRRFILAVCCVKLGHLLWLQIMLQSYSIAASVIIIGYTEDCYLDRGRMKDALVDEVMTMFLMYNFICFTPFVPDYEARYNLGYFCLIIWVGNFVYHLSRITHASFSDLILKAKIWWYRKAMFRERSTLDQVRLILKPIYRKRWALKPEATHQVIDTEAEESSEEESSSSEDSSSNENELEEIQAAVKAVSRYLKNPKQVKLQSVLKPIKEEEEEQSDEEGDGSSSVQEGSLRESVSGIEIFVENSSVAKNDYQIDCIEESKWELANENSSSSEEDDPKKRRENYLWRKQQKQLYNQMRSQFPSTNPMAIPNLIYQIKPISAQRGSESPRNMILPEAIGNPRHQRTKSNQVQQEITSKDQVKEMPRGRMQKKKDELLESTLKYFENQPQTHRNNADPDIERLPNSEHSNRQVIIESSDKDLEDFLKLGNVFPRSSCYRDKNVIQMDQQVQTQMKLDNKEPKNLHNKILKPFNEEKQLKQKR